ncbi:hypothetical protein F2Q70_00037586 [Brassica cretica]|uniref:Uncharacterized protein n=2 Tax=Brassica cretica TaxID=69181 RepID=A0A8S9JZM3_BRACR|nr:hypothetical protein F2Q68_00033047 [Brassica cretica]KAF2587555.1 hypothetical protein F2Q70_00037586 [Brassica cretica]KAF3531849.1 hypothetical protein DY000_02043619 [Brassica cretica]
MRPLLIGLILKRRIETIGIVGTVSAEADSKSFVGVTDRAELNRRAAQAVKNTTLSGFVEIEGSLDLLHIIALCSGFLNSNDSYLILLLSCSRAKSVGETTSVREAKSYLTSDLLKMKSKVISQSSGVFRD